MAVQWSQISRCWSHLERLRLNKEIL